MESNTANKVTQLLLSNRKLLFSVFVVTLGFVMFLMIFGTYWYVMAVTEDKQLVKEFDVSFDKLIDLFYAFIALVSLIMGIFTGGNYGEYVQKTKQKEYEGNEYHDRVSTEGNAMEGVQGIR